MADWASNGSYQDLSGLLPGDPVTALVPTSQEGGNMRASNEQAMTAPGSEPVDVMQPAGEYFHNDPTVSTSNVAVIEPGSDGKQQARTDTVPSPHSRWTGITTPQVKRTPMTSRSQGD